MHRAKPHEGHLRPAPRDTLPKGFAVPGWTDEQTRQCACPANTAAAGDKRKTAQSMVRKSGYRFSEKIMLKQKD